MKKKIALLLAAIMTASMIPATAFAVTTNEISKQITGTADTVFTGTKAPVLTIKDKNLNETTDGETLQIKLSLSNAEWNLFGEDGKVIKVGVKDVPVAYKPSSRYEEVRVELLTDSTLVATVKPNKEDVKGIAIPLEVKLVGEGAATVTVDGRTTVISNGTYQFGTVVSGATTTTVDKMVDIPETGGLIKPIVITETAAGSMKTAVDGSTITMKLTNGFEFKDTEFTTSIYPTSQVKEKQLKFTVDSKDPAVATAPITLIGDEKEGKTTEAIIISISNVYVKWDSDDVKAGTVCSLTISGAGITKTTLDVGTARDYSIKFEAENKTLPQFVSGRRDTEVATLKVTMSEIIANSWITSRKTTITFPEGVKILDIEKAVEKNITSGDADQYKVEDNKLTLEGFTTNNEKASIEFVFQLSIAPNFTGDIIATLGGAGVEGEIEAIVGKAIAPITVETDTNEVIIDYRKTAIGDIIIKENFAGALERGKVLTLAIDKLEFDGTPTLEVVEGDIKIEKVSTSGGQLKIEIKTATQKTPAVLKLTGVQLYLDRTIPAGYYPLKLTANDPIALTTEQIADMVTGVNYNPTKNSTDAYFQNSATDGGTYKKTTLFNTRSITLVDGFVEVVTAGRDQDDSTFTTTIVVTIGASTLTSGSQTINLDVPAYIANGYTMLPVRAVTEALSGSAIVRWDDATKTVTITFGSRIVNMVVGSNVMTMNGVNVAMSAACEITGERAFIPLRDLGYALGLNDSKINWDDATKTATLN